MNTKQRWDERIAEALETGEVPKSMTMDAAGWVTCACGEQDERLMNKAFSAHGDEEPRSAPWDYEMRELGINFSDRIHTAYQYQRCSPAFAKEQLLSANTVLHLIENRAEFLLLQIAKHGLNKVLSQGVYAK